MKNGYKLLFATLAPGALLVACTSDETHGESHAFGKVSMRLVLEDGTELDKVQWTLRKDEDVVRSGSAKVLADGSVSSAVSGVEAGSGYQVEMTGALADGLGTCEGSSPAFSVIVDRTASVKVALQCERGPFADGTVSIEGKVNFCPSQPSITASASTAEVNGDTVPLNGYSNDPDGDRVAYLWTSDSGTFTDPSSPATEFGCTEPGEATVTLTADDENGCSKETSLSVTCTPDCSALPSNDYRNPCQPASEHVQLAAGLSASYLTRNIANNADQFVYWPHNSETPSHLVVCVESSREEIADGRLQPSVQSLDLSSGEVRTIVRGMVGCDGIRTTPWGTVLATEEFADDNGGLYEILFNPESDEEYSIGERGDNGEPAVVVDSDGEDASDVIVKRVATPSMAWEGLLVLDSGVIIGGDEERPGSTGPDADGGAILKFLPAELRTSDDEISDLADSPLVAGSVWALQVSCVNNRQQAGQGCEVGNAGWVAVGAATARPDADAHAATGYYRPEDLELDPHFAGPGIRFCFANTGNQGADNFGEVMCAVDSSPDRASEDRTVAINRFIEGDGELNQPDNVAFHPKVPGLLYVIEDNAHGDVWACLPDGDDRDIKSDGCVRMASIKDSTAEPTGFIFTPDGLQAYVSVQHTRDKNMPLSDGYATDDILTISGFGIPDKGSVGQFGLITQAALARDAESLIGIEGPLVSSVEEHIGRESTFPGGVAPTAEDNGHGQDAQATMHLASSLTASYLTRVVANSADQFEFWPHGSSEPTHLMFCIEGSRELIADGKYNPSVQSVDIVTGEVKTILRGMVGCDGLRVSPWGTLLATEEFADDNGGLYEILWSPELDTEFTIEERGENGDPAVIVDSLGNSAAERVIKRIALPSMAWEGLLVLDSGVVIGGDEERPGSWSQDSDGGAIFKFVPEMLRTSSVPLLSLDESPLVAGDNYAMQVSCVNNRQQFGQGCEIGEGAWVPVGAATARPDADIVGATGYYRPEDLHLDPNYAGDGIRFCVANTGNAGAHNYGEVLCAVDRNPNVGSSSTGTITINRFIEGDTELNAPDNLEFQPESGIVYVIEDNGFGDVWACLPDGADRDIKSDGCVRALSMRDSSSEPTGFKFHPDGTKAYLVVQHSRDPSGAKVDDYNTDDVVVVDGFAKVTPTKAASFGTDVSARLVEQSLALFGLGTPLGASAN